MAEPKLTQLSLTPQEVKRFWAYVCKTDTCWEFRSIYRDGYGRFSASKKSFLAHRVSFILTFGPIPDNLLVCHNCDIFYPAGDKTYRRCVRPDHLFLGTGKVNMADMAKKGRGRHSKFTKEDVRRMRQMREGEGLSYHKIGQVFHADWSTVRDLLLGVTTHLH